ncbi:hypothetical protein [Apis mellifera associated microvirus 61]|nr:hypothetical protein [Apis mellifera associated microvirus 61]
MQTKAVSVFDKKTGLYSDPFFVRHLGDALRQWDIVRKNPDTKYGKNPEDFDLFTVGVFDDESGELIKEKPQHIASGV